MTTLITGATGLLGGHIARALHERGERVRILVRPHSAREGLAGVAVEEVYGDVRDPGSLREAMRGVDRVVHAAGGVRIDPFAADKLYRVNVEGTRHVVAAAREAGVRRLLHLSSVAAVGAGRLDKPADESSEWDLGYKGPYWSTKREGERIVLEAAAKGELDAVVINPAYAIGPGDVKPSSGAVLLLIASGLVVAYPEGGTAFVDARDVARGAVLALEKGRTGERYILSAENLTFRQFVTMAAEEIAVRPPFVPLPREVALGAARVGDALGPRFPKAFGYLNTPVVETLFELSYVSYDKARRELGYAPGPVRKAIRDAYRWFRETGRLQQRAPWRRSGHAASELQAHP
jgi:dihydroflavonol-4-reductase